MCLMQNDPKPSLPRIALRLASIGIGAAVAGNLGAALGATLGGLFSEQAAKALEEYLHLGGEKLSELGIHYCYDELREIREHPPLEATVRKALRLALKQVNGELDPSLQEAYKDWFENWDRALGIADLQLQSIVDLADRMASDDLSTTAEAVDSIFRETMEQLYAVGYVHHSSSKEDLSLSILPDGAFRTIPDSLVELLRERLPEPLKRQFNALSELPDQVSVLAEINQRFREFVRGQLTGLNERTKTIETIALRIERNTSQILQNSQQRTPDLVESLVPPDVQISKLPTVNGTLIGRDDVLDQLDQAWIDPEIRIVSIVAFGGVGKTALAVNWLHTRGAPAASRVLGWSAGSQGAREDGHASGDFFIDYALRQWYGISDPPADSWERGELLARLVRQQRTLLILDGLEPLQFPPGPQFGLLKDRGMLALLKELSAGNPGLCICTSRYPLNDLADYGSGDVVEIDLKDLKPDDGVSYLRTFGIIGEDSELRQASIEFGNHALALTLLGSLIKRWGGDISRRDMIPSLFDAKQGGHARRIMREYERVFHGKTELEVLRMLSLFDRPADPGAIRALRLFEFADWVGALESLAEARLVDYEKPDRMIDCHPLIREHFSEEFKATATDAFQAAHLRLYQHYCELAPHRPDAIQVMEPLFHAVRHGCLAKMHQEVWDKVYVDRMLRGGSEYFLTQKLGELGLSLSVIAEFFEPPWKSLVPGLDLVTQLWVLGEAGFTLTTLRRLADAIDPMEAAVQGYKQAEDWENVSLCCNNLSELHLRLGNISDAISAGRSAVEFADKCGVTLCRMGCRATLGHAQHQAGLFEEAKHEFEVGEQIQATAEPERPCLYGQPLFQYCVLLLDQGQNDDVTRRIRQAEPFSNTLLFEALDHLALGRAHPAGTAEAAAELDHAVATFRRSEQLDQLPLALLTRASNYRAIGEFRMAERDLREVQLLADRPGMRLHLADYQIESAHLCHAQGKAEEARIHFNAARQLVSETGYRRRSGDLLELSQLFA